MSQGLFLLPHLIHPLRVLSTDKKTLGQGEPIKWNIAAQSALARALQTSYGFQALLININGSECGRSVTENGLTSGFMWWLVANDKLV
jgi:hypothetical protein